MQLMQSKVIQKVYLYSWYTYTLYTCIYLCSWYIYTFEYLSSLSTIELWPSLVWTQLWWNKVTLGGLLQVFRRQGKTHLCKILQVMRYIQSPKKIYTCIYSFFFPRSSQWANVGIHSNTDPRCTLSSLQKNPSFVEFDNCIGGGACQKTNRKWKHPNTWQRRCVCVCVLTKPVSIAPQYSWPPRYLFVRIAGVCT
jgi:hypothetical protein